MGRDGTQNGRAQMDAISIHSPRMGRDLVAHAGTAEGGLFQSTLPAWGETRKTMQRILYMGISIHSPRMGRDEIGSTAICEWCGISIHSPHTGRDTG